MTVTYHSGRRLQGLDADRTATALPAGSVGGWVELGRTTLGSSSANIDVTGLADKRYLMVLSNFNSSTTSGNPYIRINGDTGSNYSMRYSRNGGADGTITSSSAGIFIANIANTDLPYFMVDYIANYSSKEKLLLHHMVNQNTAGAGTAPNRSEVAGKWANTSNAVSQVNINGNGVNIDSGGEVVVLGYDPADTHTTNFWQELGTTTLSSDSTSMEISFTSKKYLWVQAWTKPNTGNAQHIMRVGNSTIDSGSNYANRTSGYGGSGGEADATGTNQGGVLLSDDNPAGVFSNTFIINNASNEKLFIGHTVHGNTAGAGNAPERTEFVTKWANTSNQIDTIRIFTTTNQLATGSKFKVWGAD